MILRQRALPSKLQTKAITPPEPPQGTVAGQPSPSKRYSCFKGKKSDISAEKTPKSLHRCVGRLSGGRCGGAGGRSGHPGEVRKLLLSRVVGRGEGASPQ